MGTPFKMKGFSGFTSNSPLRQEEIENVLEDSEINQLRKPKKGKISSKRKFKKKTVIIGGKTYDKPVKTEVNPNPIDYSKLTDAELEALRVN